MVEIIVDYIPSGRRNRPAKPNPCSYITIHNTGNTQAGSNAKAHANYLKNSQDVADPKSPKSWHYTVDGAVIYQHIPDNETAYHAGDGAGKGNTQSIGIEICMNSDGDLIEATENTVSLVAKLMKDHDIAIENVVQHNYWSGKNCPQMLRSGNPYSWTTFIEKVKDAVMPKETKPSWADPYWNHLNQIGCEIEEKRYSSPITRGEVFALLSRYHKARAHM